MDDEVTMCSPDTTQRLRSLEEWRAEARVHVNTNAIAINVLKQEVKDELHAVQASVAGVGCRVSKVEKGMYLAMGGLAVLQLVLQFVIK